MNLDPLPPGETGTELQGAEAAAALSARMARIAECVQSIPRLFLTVRDFTVTPDGRKVRVWLKFADGSQVTVRVSRRRAGEFHEALGKVLGR